MTANQLQYQRNLITTAELDETKRHNEMSEQAEFNKAVAALRQAGASEEQARAALINAAANEKNAETNRKGFWLKLGETIASHFGLTPKSSVEIGSSALKGAGALL